MKDSSHEKLFLEFYDKYADAIFRHCYFRVFDRDKAKDLTQEAFMKLWKYIIKDQTIKYPQALIFKIANNLIIDYHRKKKEASLEKMQEDGFQPSINTEEQLLANIDAAQLIETINSLKDHHREVLLLRYVQGFKPKEISEILGQTQNVVSVRITRAKIKLRRLVELSEKKYETSK